MTALSKDWRIDDLFEFIYRRHRIYQLRKEGHSKPWTSDPILQRYRFCNVYRELDTQTIWFAENWRKPHENDEDLWFASLVFRFVNWHETAEELGFPIPFRARRFGQVLKERGEAGKKVYSGAYMISTHGVKQPKYEYLMSSLEAIWRERARIRYQPHGANGGSLAYFHQQLMGCFDVGSFLAAQVIADCKYTPRMDSARDWVSFAASGPGSRRGLNRVLNMPVKDPWKEAEWKYFIDKLRRDIAPLIHTAGMPSLHAQDLQNCLCEFDKYERVRLGEGRPKSTYPGV